MKGLVVRKPIVSRRCAREYGRMLRLMLWAAFAVTLALAHFHLRMAARDLEMQKARLQSQETEMLNEENRLRSEVARLREGEQMLEYGHEKLRLVALPADQIEVWNLPNVEVEKYSRVCSEIAMARTGAVGRTEPEPLVVRLIGAVFSPVEARPADPGR